MNKMTWTIAYRKPRANRFQRVTNWCGSWTEAYHMSQRFGQDHPELSVWYVPTAEQEATTPGHEDNGNILTNTGQRVRIVDNAILPEQYVTECSECGSTEGPDRQTRWETGDPIGLDEWDRCEKCWALLCDSCAMANIHHCH